VAQTDISAWIALFIGLYALSAAIGELRSRGMWAGMLDQFEANSALQFLTGIVLIAIGAAIYLVNPWRPEDWLSVLVAVLGGGMVLEGAVMLAIGRPYMHFAGKLLVSVNRFWALLAAAIGALLIVVALLRI
jgi:vacuolar-type H+-ATPase subunit I/STV1